MGVAAAGTYGSLFQASSSAGTDPRQDPLASKTTDSQTTTAKADIPAVLVELSDQAKAALAAMRDVPTSLDEILAKRSEAMAAKLTKAFQSIGISPDEATLLKIDASGEIATDSPYKKKIEEFFESDPEAVKELKAIASLSELKAAQEALKIFLEEKKAARNEDEAEAAYGRHTSLSLTIHKLSDALVLKDGKLSSAALDYVEASKPQTMRDAEAAANGAPPPALPRVA